MTDCGPAGAAAAAAGPATPPQGGRGSAIDDCEDGISIEALRIFEQSGPIAEAVLASCWGLRRDDIRTIRNDMAEGTEWSQDGQKIVLLPQGAARLAAHFGISDFSHFEKKGGQDSEAAGGSWFVHSAPRNPKLVLLAEKKGGPARARLRVRDNRNFVTGMDLTGKLRLIAGHEDFYELIGNQPRFRGRF